MKRLLVLILAGVSGCGYHLAGQGPAIPAAANTISIRPFHNRTREHGLEVYLQRALEDEFRRHGRLRVVPDPQGDIVLSGEIKTITSTPVAFSGTDEAVQYQGVMMIAMRLTERESGRVLHETKALQETQDFGAVSGVVIQSSPHFQRGTMDARDLANMNNVQLGESRRTVAIRALVDSTARDVYLQTMEGF